MAVIVGFDSEWVNSALAEQIDGDANCNVVVSYQTVVLNTENGLHCECLIPIDEPTKRKRLSLAGLLGVALRQAKHLGVIPDFPGHVILAGHFTRADLTALKDWSKFKDKFDSVRKTMVTTFEPYKALVPRYKNRSDCVLIKVTLVDTMLLAPARSSLAKLGAVIGLEKFSLAPGVIERMDLLLCEDPELFERYALRDAEIAVHYYDSICQTLKSEFGVNKHVVTLGAAGVHMLRDIMAGLCLDEDGFFGYRRVKGKGRFVIDECATIYPFAANCYHGGRNEAYWIGPTKPLSDAASIGDFDLSGAYTTAMTFVREPRWIARCNEYRLERLAVVEDAMTFARVRFEFPSETRFPCLPVRAGERGLLYPLTGESWCTGPELVVAVNMGAKIEVLDGCRIEWVENSESPFLNFTRRIDKIRKKAKAEKNELLNQTAKEIGNSLYGKAAQAVEAMRSIRDGGVDGKARGRRNFNSRTGKTETLPPSRITCPPIAAYTTGLVRAALSEALSRLPADANVSSATTDGFLAEISMAQIPVDGPVARAFSAARVRIDDNPTIWELKHEVEEAIIIKTRGAITTRLRENDSKKVVLARAGYRLDKRIEDPWAEC